MTSQQSEYNDENDLERGELEEDLLSQTDGGIEEDDLDEKYPKIGSSSETTEQKQSLFEYAQIVKEICGQNKTIEEIKERIMALCAKPCKTCAEEKDIHTLRVCMEQENLKLKCLITKAMQLQNFGSHRRWPDLPIVTTFDEDNLKPYVSCTSPRKYKNSEESNSMPCGSKECAKKKVKLGMAKHDSEEGRHMRMMITALKKLNITCPKDKKLVHQIAKVLCAQKSKPCPPPYPPPCSTTCPPPCPSPCKKKVKRSKSDTCGPSMSNELLEGLKRKISKMQANVCKIKKEIYKSEEQHRPQATGDGEDTISCHAEPDALRDCGGKKSTKAEQIEKLKESYCYLLSEYSKKEAQLKQLKIRAEASGINTSDGKKADTELCLLKAQISEMKEEQQEYKCIMKEQSHQLEDYRNKYLSAQQKVEEQCVLLEKLNMNNKRIEKQINCEIKDIRAKFQEKLADLLQLPKLLENEQLKVADMNKEKEELEKKLVLVCKELNAMREKERPNEVEDLGPELEQCRNENEELKRKVSELERQRTLCCQQLRTTQDDLDTLRCESAKIIARTKERTELIRLQQQECINKLEKDLAQCRATACLSVSDREAVIREMQGQLNTLSFSFDAAQKQIKTLRNHIAYVSNENCYPVKCQ